MSIHDTQLYVPGPGDGIPGATALPGSGFAVPAGLEAILEFNGLLMNVQKNTDRIKITSIDGLHDADIRDTRDSKSGQDGEIPYNSFYGGRTIAITGTIQSYSIPKLRDMQMALSAAFNDVTQEYPLHFRLGDFTKDHFINCKKISPITSTETQSDYSASRDFQLSLRASNPCFLSYLQSFLDAELSGDMVFTPASVGIVHNRGTYWAQPIYRIYGKCTRTTIYNQLTNKQFSVGFIEDGDYLEYDLSQPNPTFQNSRGEDAWEWLNDDSDYVYLKGGVNGCDNPIYYSGDTPRITIMWRDSWL